MTGAIGQIASEAGVCGPSRQVNLAGRKLSKPRTCVLGVAVLATLWLVQACTPLAQTDAFATLSPVYDPALVWRAGHKNGLRTILVGSPFTDKSLSDTDFTLVSTATSRRGYRLVLIFNPASPLSFGEACEDLDGIETSEATQTVRLHAAFCTGERPLSEIDGRGGDLQSVLDQTLAGLLPPNNRDKFREGRCTGVFRLCL